MEKTVKIDQPFFGEKEFTLKEFQKLFQNKEMMFNL